jgi:DNA-directed RNA polymerase II subunit RPB2
MLDSQTQFVDDGFKHEPEYDYANENRGEGDEAKPNPISQEDYWTVINTFFEGKGLVRQQLESFNEFIENTMQELVDESRVLTLDQHSQYTGAVGDETVCTDTGTWLTIETVRNHVWANLSR